MREILFTEYVDFEISLILYSAHTVRVMCNVYCVMCIKWITSRRRLCNSLCLVIADEDDQPEHADDAECYGS